MRASRFRIAPAVAAGILVTFVSAQAAAGQTPPPSSSAGQQHQHEPPPKPAAAQIDHSQMGHGGVSTLREASGTSWQPDASLMYAMHRQRGAWELMAHGNGFLQYLNEGSARGADQFGSINWVMGMAERDLGPGRLAFRGMFSFEPFTVGGCGYPDLLATGELCDGDAIHDRQHQHDLFMEVAAMYDAPLGGDLRWQIYGGPAGEPALGPVAYPHRISAMPNLLAPIAHHWLDATHITFGVVTAGVYGSRWKAEASAFNGREPDEDRTGFDFAALDSVSGRLWYLPNDTLALQVSAGRLNEAEPGEEGGPRVDVTRITASATYHRLLGAAGIWANTLAWGRNAESGQGTNALLLETSLTLDDRDAWYGRFEIAGKTAHDLDVAGGHHGEDEEVFTVGKLQAGYTRYFGAWNELKPGLGFTASLSAVPEALEHVYGARVNPGVGIYLTLRPAAMRMGMTHTGAAAPPSATPAAAPRATPADPHAGHGMPARPAATPAPKPADPHAGHATAPAPAKRTAIADDPKKLVCESPVNPTSVPATTYKGKAYYFCTAAERLRFIQNPETYLKEAGIK